MSMLHYGLMQVPSVPNQPKTSEIPAKTQPKCIKKTHRGNHKLKNFSGEIPRTSLTRGGMPPLVFTPTRAFGTRSDFRRTTFNLRGDGPDWLFSFFAFVIESLKKPLLVLQGRLFFYYRAFVQRWSCGSNCVVWCIIYINEAQIKCSNAHLIITRLNCEL